MKVCVAKLEKHESLTNRHAMQRAIPEGYAPKGEYSHSYKWRGEDETEGEATTCEKRTKSWYVLIFCID